MTDLLLAIVHHLLIFSLLGVLVWEMMMIRPGLTNAGVLRLGRVDVAYGAIAGAIIIVGFSRVFFGAKGADFYVYNPIFWAKIGAFLVVGLLSAPPTIRIIAWRNAARRDPNYVPAADEMNSVRRFMHWEGFVFVLIPIFAAMMARGYGL